MSSTGNNIVDWILVHTTDDCPYCKFVKPVLDFLVKNEFTSKVHYKYYNNRDDYLQLIADFVEKYNDEFHYPILEIFRNGKKSIIPATVVREILLIMGDLDPEIQFALFDDEEVDENLIMNEVITSNSLLMKGIEDAFVLMPTYEVTGNEEEDL
ncbi:MAG: hypothetical protein ACTSYA_08960 [Candidatus Kariarchaeaceae archaeon]